MCRIGQHPHSLSFRPDGLDQSLTKYRRSRAIRITSGLISKSVWRLPIVPTPKGSVSSTETFTRQPGRQVRQRLPCKRGPSLRAGQLEMRGFEQAHHHG